MLTGGYLDLFISKIYMTISARNITVSYEFLTSTDGMYMTLNSIKDGVTRLTW